jgi:hypothetical protein
MSAVEYKVFIGGESATQEQLDKIEEITVKQIVDGAWEARIRVPVCVNPEGKWEGENEAWMRSFTQIRIEVNPGGASFVPLIDGPVVGFESERSALPGKSVVTIIVHDDSAKLNRRATVDVQVGQKDSDLARRIFDDAGFPGPHQIDETPAQPNQTTDASVQRGTPMNFLRDLLQRNRNWHAYVLPGRDPGQTIGCFRKFPEERDDDLPDMVLLGDGRNIETFNVNSNAQTPCSVVGATLSISHDQVQTSTSRFSDATLMGDSSPDAEQGDQAECLLPPGQSDRVDLETAARNARDASTFSLEASGSTVPFCYAAVLSPYRWVLVKISNSQYSGRYLIHQVTHTLTRSIYTQTFQMKGNAITAGESNTADTPQPSASFSFSFNVQVSIF